MSCPVFVRVAICLLFPACCFAEDAPIVRQVTEINVLPSKIAFGSCGHQNKPQPVLERVVEVHPDLFVYLGDNIYGDSRDMDELRAKYALLAAKPEFIALRKNVATVATWDDHDYGENDAGKNYPFKEESKTIFMEFWKVPAESPRYTHPGIFGVHEFEEDGKRLQILVLDTRTFRDDLLHNSEADDADSGYKNDYRPDPSPEKTMLGELQWKWLEEQLQKPADVRIICSSIQFGHEYNGYESWTNLPRERQRMLDTIRRTQANGVLFISGDVHWAELSKRTEDLPYPLYDLTASGITEKWPHIEPSRYREQQAVAENHFGMVTIDWTVPDPQITLQIIDVEGQVRIEKAVALSELQFPEE